MENKAHNIRIHNTIVKMLQHPEVMRYLALLIKTTCDTDAAVRRVLNVLAATQEIPLAQKDLLRKQIRAWYKANVGDRTFFADSDLHRKHKRVVAWAPKAA